MVAQIRKHTTLVQTSLPKVNSKLDNADDLKISPLGGPNKTLPVFQVHHTLTHFGYFLPLRVPAHFYQQFRR